MDQHEDDNIRASVDNFRASHAFDKVMNQEPSAQQEDDGNFFREFVSKIEQKHKTNVNEAEPPVFDFYSFPQKVKKEYAKYDDKAFKKDLERFQDPNGADEVDVRNIIRTALQVEDETRQMKSKIVGGKFDPLY